MKNKSLLITLSSFLLAAIPMGAKAADAYWLDQYNALLYVGTFQLDKELREISEEGTKTLLLHADALPSPLSRFIAWRAKEAGGMESIAWIQKPNKVNLKHAAKLVGFKGVQIDDHYFNDPPISVTDLKQVLGGKELWCSFQPRQFSFQVANICDQNDIQIYRYSCRETGDIAWRMGITGNHRVAVAAYNDGSKEGDKLIKCIKRDLKKMSTKLFVFKWKNQEDWSKRLWRLTRQLGINI